MFITPKSQLFCSRYMSTDPTILYPKVCPVVFSAVVTLQYEYMYIGAAVLGPCCTDVVYASLSLQSRTWQKLPCPLVGKVFIIVKYEGHQFKIIGIKRNLHTLS